MKITLDTETQAMADKIMAYLHQPPSALTGLVHDALLVGALSRSSETLARAETVANVAPGSVAVELDLTVPFGSDTRIVGAGAQVAAWAAAWKLAPEVVALAAVRAGMRLLCPPANVLAAGGVR
jgi:hypothetical protein